MKQCNASQHSTNQSAATESNPNQTLRCIVWFCNDYYNIGIYHIVLCCIVFGDVGWGGVMWRCDGLGGGMRGNTAQNDTTAYNKAQYDSIQLNTTE